MDLITAKQKAEQLGVDRSTLSRWVRDEKITPAMTLNNGAMLFDPDSVPALVLYTTTNEDGEKS